MSAPKAPTLAMLPFFPRDYLSATRGMTLAERGAYTDLLFFEWDMGPLPEDPRRLARMLGIDAGEFASVWPALKPKFQPDGDGCIINLRLERERSNSLDLRSKRSKKARQAAGARWVKENARSNAPSMDNGHAPSIPEAMLGTCPPSPSPSPSPSSSSAQSPSESGRDGGSLKKAVANKSSQDKSTAIDAVDRAKKMIAANPGFSDAEIAKVTHAKIADVKAARTALPKTTH